jgi:predicted dehydrogenase
MNLSWLDARDAERVTVVGSRRTAVLDTRALERKLTVYDQPAPRRPGAGEIVAPRIAAADPVAIECESFIARVRSGGEGAAPHAAAAAVALIDELDRTAAAEATAQQGSRQQEEPPPPRLELVQS